VTDRAIGERIAVGIAVLWSVGLLVGALTLPVYERVTVTANGSIGSSATLVEENGGAVLAIVAIPLVVTAGVALALRSRYRKHRKGPGVVAPVLTGLVLIFCVLGMLTIGVFVLPVAIALVVACALAS